MKPSIFANSLPSKRFDFFALRDFNVVSDCDEVEEVIVDEIEEVAPPPPEPVFYSQLEVDRMLEKAKQEAHAEFFAQAVEKAGLDEEKLEQALLLGIEAMRAQLQNFQAEYHSSVKAKHAELVELGLLVAKKLAGSALEKNPTAAIEDMLSSCLPLLLKKPKIVLTMHPTTLKLFNKKAKNILENKGFEGILNIESSDDLLASDCRINWGDGQAEKNSQALWQDILKLLGHCPPNITAPEAINVKKSKNPEENINAKENINDN